MCTDDLEEIQRDWDWIRNNLIPRVSAMALDKDDLLKYLLVNVSAVKCEQEEAALLANIMILPRLYLEDSHCCAQPQLTLIFLDVIILF